MQKPAPPQDFDWSAYTISKPEDFARNMLRLMEDGGKVMSASSGAPDGRPAPTAPRARSPR